VLVVIAYQRVESTPDSADEGSDDGYAGMEMSTSALTKPKRKAYEIDYDSLSVADVEAIMTKEAEYISGMFSVDVSPSPLQFMVFWWFTPFRVHSHNFQYRPSNERL
jgi:hypothetical protein